MEKKKKDEELQSRRQFFKRAAKGALPILGAIALSQMPILGQAHESGKEMGCSNGCYTNCYGGCKGTCTSNCAEGCTGCGTACYRGCAVGCTGGCTGCRYK